MRIAVPVTRFRSLRIRTDFSMAYWKRRLRVHEKIRERMKVRIRWSTALMWMFDVLFV